MQANIFPKIKNIIVEQLSVEADTITRSNFIQDLGADSLDAVELVMALEEEFDIEIRDEVVGAGLPRPTIWDNLFFGIPLRHKN